MIGARKKVRVVEFPCLTPLFILSHCFPRCHGPEIDHLQSQSPDC